MSAYNLRNAKVGDLVRVTLEDAEYDMTVHTVMEPGAYGVGYQHGPRVLAWIRPGGYGLTLNASNVVALEAIEVCSECDGTIYDGNPEHDDAPRQVYTLRDLDGTDDAADWITTGHVLDAQEVDWLRSLRVVAP